MVTKSSKSRFGRMLLVFSAVLCGIDAWGGQPTHATARTEPAREASAFDPLQIRPMAPDGSFGAFFAVRTETSDVAIDYGLSEHFSLGLRAIRNHWPNEVELHYGLAQLTSRFFEERGAEYRSSAYAFTGAGMANKLSGINRAAFLLGFESDYETPYAYLDLQISTIGATDFEQKYFVRGRAGLFPYFAGYHSFKSLLLIHALYENRAAHSVDWGPVVHFQYSNFMAELYGTFKGAFSFSFGFFY